MPGSVFNVFLPLHVFFSVMFLVSFVVLSESFSEASGSTYKIFCYFFSLFLFAFALGGHIYLFLFFPKKAFLMFTFVEGYILLFKSFQD